MWSVKDSIQGIQVHLGNRREGANNTKMVLDKVFANSSAILELLNALVRHVNKPVSDHSCLVLSLDALKLNDVSGRRRFHLEAAWTKFEECEKIIFEAWTESGLAASAGGVVVGLEACAAKLFSSNKLNFGNLREQLKLKRSHLESIQYAAPTKETYEKRLQVEKTLIKSWN